jgi:hypothetical protein
MNTPSGIIYDTDSEFIPIFTLEADTCFSRKQGLGWQITLYPTRGWAQGCGKSWRSPFSTWEEAIAEAQRAIAKYSKTETIPPGIFN